MDINDFIKFLKDWVEKINNKNNQNNFIVLEEKYFPRNEDNKYHTNDEELKCIRNPKLLFIADNPGDNEKKHFEYLYYNACNNIDGYFRTAGYKFNNFISKLNLKSGDVIKFNKCLISTHSTSQLTSEQIDETLDIVCSFIEEFNKVFPDCFILFSGVSGIKNGTSKFLKLYEKLDSILKKDNVGFMGHISRKKFPDLKKCNLNNFDIIKKLSIDYKKRLFNNKEDDSSLKCEDCIFFSFCNEYDDNGNSNGDDSGDCSPQIVDA